MCLPANCKNNPLVFFSSPCLQYMRFVERISRAMKMDDITADMGIDSCTDAIMARAEQLVKHEFDALNDRKTHIYNLQRKVKSQKEALDSKELHMEMLRKKVGDNLGCG